MTLALLAIAIVVALYVPALLTRRALVEVVRSFYRHKALGAENAKTIEELGLGSPGLLQRIGRPRDYKPNALRVLLRTGAVHVLEDRRMYLTEENLHDSLKCKM